MFNHTTRLLQFCFAAILFVSISFTSAAQGNRAVLPFIEHLLEDMKTVTYYTPGETAHATNNNPESSLKRAKRISKVYTGYAIELVKTDVPLLSTNAIFKKYGNITYDRNDDGSYSYFIVPEFTTKKNIKEFISTVLKSSFPDAKIVKYKNGKR